MFRILRNAAYCRGCRKVIESKSRHDYVECDCGNAVDGGLDYARRVGDVAKLVDLSRYVEEDGTIVDEASKALNSENGEAVDVILKWVATRDKEEKEKMKYYRLKRDLPTFKEGELFYTDDLGSLYRVKDDLMAYYHKTVAKFPNILEDWFEEVPAPIRDIKTKAAFEAYVTLHPDERFFQAVRNFTRRYLNTKKTGAERPFIIASDLPPTELYADDTFHWECDEMLKEDDETES